MKRVLITGANSYIGTNFEKWISANGIDFITETIDMVGKEWKDRSFKGFDSVFHVAGIAHADVGKVSEEQKALYYRVNTDLAIECAKKAKDDGVNQFVYMSSIIVYGECKGIGETYVIDRNTPVSPANFYGDSKVKAERGLKELQNDYFHVAILRPPMIYGKNAKGNYRLLAKLARRCPFFPKIKNQRSMLYIENLCKFVSLVISNNESGTFFPQNKQYVCTSEMVQQIARAHGKNIQLVSFLNPVLYFLGKKKVGIGSLINKAFGNMVYVQEMSIYSEDYNDYSYEESIFFTER